jgi:hypothetical protein
MVESQDHFNYVVRLVNRVACRRCVCHCADIDLVRSRDITLFLFLGAYV